VPRGSAIHAKAELVKTRQVELIRRSASRLKGTPRINYDVA
jgi:hypothetical protein